ncbi:MAG: hypothetical protein NW226_22980 [Microscillaceae bacterium]|nr:hypothetical protein [Microscillaceae bacterium]
MKDVLESFDEFESAYGPHVDFEDLERRRQIWLQQLTEEEAIQLLEWATNPFPLSNLNDSYYDFPENARIMAVEYAAFVGERLRSEAIRKHIESLAGIEALHYAILSGLGILADPKSISFLRDLIPKVENDLLYYIAGILIEIRNEEAKQVLLEMKQLKFYQENTDFRNFIDRHLWH